MVAFPPGGRRVRVAHVGQGSEGQIPSFVSEGKQKDPRKPGVLGFTGLLGSHQRRKGSMAGGGGELMVAVLFFRVC